MRLCGGGHNRIDAEHAIMRMAAKARAATLGSRIVSGHGIGWSAAVHIISGAHAEEGQASEGWIGCPGTAAGPALRGQRG
jgi:hypothetical protein